MTDVVVNYWAVLVSAVGAMVIGYFWYSPAVFGTMWMTAVGRTPEDQQATMTPVRLLWMYVVAFITAYILSHFIQLVGANSLADALSVAFWAWLGFMLTVIISNGLAEKRSTAVIIVTAGYQLVTLLVMAAILFSWK